MKRGKVKQGAKITNYFKSSDTQNNKVSGHSSAAWTNTNTSATSTVVGCGGGEVISGLVKGVGASGGSKTERKDSDTGGGEGSSGLGKGLGVVLSLD